MEIEIDSKKNNPLLNRTEVYFTVKHPGEGTPNREIIRSELADKLNVKKENIVVNTIQSSFGNQEISCYAKVYASLDKTKDWEQDFILKRNQIIGGKEKKKEEKPAKAPKPEAAGEEPAGEVKEEPPVDTQEPSKEESTPEPETVPEPPAEEKAEEPATTEPPVEDNKPEEPPKEESTEEKPEKKPEEQEESEEKKE